MRRLTVASLMVAAAAGLAAPGARADSDDSTSDTPSAESSSVPETSPKFDSNELSKLHFKAAKDHKSLSHRDKLIADAEKKLAPADFDRFMSDVGAMEEKVKQGKPRAKPTDDREPQSTDEILNGDDVPQEVKFGGEAPGAIQKGEQFFQRPVSD